MVSADISKCLGEGCDKKEKCLRFTVPEHLYQSFIAPNPHDCDMFWERAPIPQSTPKKGPAKRIVDVSIYSQAAVRRLKPKFKL